MTYLGGYILELGVKIGWGDILGVTYWWVTYWQVKYRAGMTYLGGNIFQWDDILCGNILG